MPFRVCVLRHQVSWQRACMHRPCSSCPACCAGHPVRGQLPADRGAGQLLGSCRPGLAVPGQQACQLHPGGPGPGPGGPPGPAGGHRPGPAHPGAKAADPGKLRARKGHAACATAALPGGALAALRGSCCSENCLQLAGRPLPAASPALHMPPPPPRCRCRCRCSAWRPSARRPCCTCATWWAGRRWCTRCACRCPPTNSSRPSRGRSAMHSLAPGRRW